MEKENAKYLAWHIYHENMVSAKTILNLFEDLRDNNKITPEEYTRYRGRVLSSINDCIRSLISIAEPYDFDMSRKFKFE